MSKFRFVFFLAVHALTITSDAGAQNVAVEPGIQVGTFSDPDIKEISGIALSRSIANTLWLHEDSGADPAFFGVDINSGTVHSKVLLQGAPAVDWEDMAIAPKPGGGNYLYFGDIGDNGANRNLGVDIIRITEPATVGNTTLSGSDYKVKRVSYPGLIFFREEDAESLFADPLTGDIYIVQKLNPGKLYRLPVQEFDVSGTYVLDSLGSINAPLSKPTAADISPDGKYIIIRNSSAGGTTGYLFVRDINSNETVASAMRGTPMPFSMQSEQQGEAIAWAADGSGFYSISEGNGSPIWFYAISTTASFIPGFSAQTALKIYPNPAGDVLFAGGDNILVKQLSVTDLAGRTISRSDLNTIDISGLSPGNYLVEVLTNSGRTAGRFIKK